MVGQKRFTAEEQVEVLEGVEVTTLEQFFKIDFIVNAASACFLALIKSPDAPIGEASALS